MFFICCNKPIENAKNRSETTTNNKKITTADTITKPPQINYKDSNGLKQGIWITSNKQKDKILQTYRNDTLNGYFSEGKYGWRHEGFYKNGKVNGIVRTYCGAKVQYIGAYINGNTLWSVCFQDLLMPVKGFQLKNDTTIYLIAPYPSGKTWYEGEFISTKTYKSKALNHYETFPLGIHKIYFTNGQLKGIVDYTKKSIIEYDSSGKLRYNTKLENIEIHKHMYPTIYLE